MSMVYASELAASALNLEPVGTPHTTAPCRCAMCQRQILQGDISSTKSLPRTFMDFWKLDAGEFLCGYCAATSTQDVLRELQRSVITRNGIYNLNKDESRAWFWLTPPEPPFAVVLNHNTMAAFHYHWRTPVTLDVEAVQINVENTIYQVRRSRVLQAVSYGRLIVEKGAALAKKKTVLKSPFIQVLRDPTSPKGVNGHLNKACLELAVLQPDLAEAIEYLEYLSPGELIAVSSLLKAKPSDPIQPSIITSIKGSI